MIHSSFVDFQNVDSGLSLWEIPDTDFWERNALLSEHWDENYEKSMLSP